MKIILTIIICLSFLAPVKAQETSLPNKVDTIIGEGGMSTLENTTLEINTISDKQISDYLEFRRNPDGVAPETSSLFGMLDLSSFFNNIRSAAYVNMKKEVFLGGHVPVISIIGRKTKLEYVNFNLGGAYSKVDKKTDIMVSIGFRLDNYLAKLDNYPNIRTAKMPSVEIGPFFSYAFGSTMAGGMVAVGFGGK